jgi:hypothetical protein
VITGRFGILCAWTAVLACSSTQTVRAELPNPVLNVVYPASVQAGGSTVVALEGTSLEELTELRSTAPGFTAEKLVDPKKPGARFTVSVPAWTPPGTYDIRTVGRHGVSSPRAFVVSRLAEQLEGEVDDTPETPNVVALNAVVNGRIEKAGDIDRFRFTAKAGERVVVECRAASIDSQLRPVLELYDTHGVRLAANRGYHGIDALIDFITPTAGEYELRAFDLTYAGGPSHFYRLSIDTAPRSEFALPCVVRQGTKAAVTLYGRNLHAESTRTTAASSSAATSPQLESLQLTLGAPKTADPFAPLAQRPAQFAAESFAYHHPGANEPLAIGLTDLPVIENHGNHDVRPSALAIPVPCEVSALVDNVVGRHWYSLEAKRGEVFWFEALAERLGSPLDLELTILDATGDRELARLSGGDDFLAGYRFSTAHSDPVGRFVAPADGRYYVFVRDVIVGSSPDPRRVYRLSVRREEPDFALAAVSRRTDQPAALNIARGGREWLEVVALRRRGLTGPIRVSVAGLPAGVECPDAWIGTEQDRVPLVFSAVADAASFTGPITITGRYDQAGVVLERTARVGTMIWPNRPTPSGRLAQEQPLAVAGDVPYRLVAATKEDSVDQEGILDVELTLEARGERPTAPVRLAAIGLPRGASAEPIELQPENLKGWMSVRFSGSVPSGPFTFAIAAEVEGLVAPQPNAKPAKLSLTAVSNPITVTVKPARVVLSVDPSSPVKIARGKIMQLKFAAKRTGGFIGKVHVELETPGGIDGVRARGVTLVGGTETGSLQVIATDNAPLGPLKLLRLEAVGTVEDKPVYRAGLPLTLEITE